MLKICCIVYLLNIYQLIAPSVSDCLFDVNMSDDALYGYRRGIDLNKYMKVFFVGEPAADEGRPLGEFLYLLVQDSSQTSNLFCGEEGNHVTLKKQAYLKFGGDASYLTCSPRISTTSWAVADYILYGMGKCTSYCQ